MILCAIAAMSENRVIGKENKLPWHIPEDLQYFKEMTLGKIIIMGRKTFESIGRPLPKRKNIVITRQKNFDAKGAEVFENLDQTLAFAEKNSQEAKEVFIVGGAEIYKLALPKIQKFYTTIIHKNFDGDAFFPEFEKDFKKISERKSSQENPERLIFSFEVWERN